MNLRHRVRGFTLVELMVTIGIFALLSALAVPTLRSVIENNRIKAAAQSLQNGLAMARAEAVRLNTRVAFTLTGAGWSITRTDDNSLLQQASGKEKASGVKITPDPAGAVVFDAFGRKSSGPTRIDVEAIHPSSRHKPLTVELSANGTARLCDEKVASTEPKACIYL